MNDLNAATERVIVVSCAPFIAPYLRQEIIDLGYEIREDAFTSISTEGTFEDAIRLNVHLRSANRVLLLIKKFAAVTMDEIYQSIRTIAWEEILFDDGYFSVHSVVEHPEVSNTMFVNVRVKDAIADRFMETKKKRPDSGAEKDKAVIFLFWKNNEAMIYIDTSGEPLTKHGYRKLASKAPLQESLAAAIIYSTRWDRSSNFINPMCGGGTLAIEAALMAINKPPGLMRQNYGFMHVLEYDESSFKRVIAEAEKNIRKNSAAKIIASDNDEQALKTARSNALNAGVNDIIQWIRGDFAVTPVPGEGKGIVVFNPPYGERLGAETALEHTYEEMGNFLKHSCKGYWGYILTANMELAKKIGLKPKRKIDFYNGQLKCKLLEFELYEGSKKSRK